MFRQPVLHLVALLLDYPDADLRQALPEMAAALDTLSGFQGGEKSMLCGHIQWMQAQAPLQLVYR